MTKKQSKSPPKTKAAKDFKNMDINCENILVGQVKGKQPNKELKSFYSIKFPLEKHENPWDKDDSRIS